jgi:hypothetical protein
MENIMNKTFNEKELGEATATLKQKKSPGPDEITNEMILHLGPRARLLQIFNTSWKNGAVPQIWRKAVMIPIHNPGKDKIQTY